MKKILSFVIGIMTFMSCANVSDDLGVEPSRNLVDVGFNIQNPLEVTVTRGSSMTPADAGLKYLYVFVDGDYTNVITTSDNPTLANVTLKISEGEHTITFVGSPGELDRSDNIIKFIEGKRCDVFGSVKTITVRPAMSAQNITLNRLVSQLYIKFNDLIPSDVNRVSISFSKYVSSISTHSLIGAVSSKEIIYDIPESAHKNTDISFGIKTFCPDLSNPWSQNITVTAYNNDNVVMTRTIENVPLLANRATTIEGVWFGMYSGITVNAEWYDEYIIDINK